MTSPLIPVALAASLLLLIPVWYRRRDYRRAGRSPEPLPWVDWRGRLLRGAW